MKPRKYFKQYGVRCGGNGGNIFVKILCFWCHAIVNSVTTDQRSIWVRSFAKQIFDCFPEVRSRCRKWIKLTENKLVIVILKILDESLNYMWMEIIGQWCSQPKNLGGQINFFFGVNVWFLQARRQDLAAGGQKPEGGAKNQKGGHYF